MIDFYYRVILSSGVQWLLGNSATIQFTVHSLCGLNLEPLGLLFNHYANATLWKVGLYFYQVCSFKITSVYIELGK